MNDQVDRTYYESTSWRSMRGCNNCAGYEPDAAVGGINQCNNGKYNGNGLLCNCDAWVPDLEQKLMDKVSQLEAENASLRERTRWIPVGERLPEDGVEVLVVNAFDHVYTDYRYESGMDSIVTHWMPLPEAPKEDEE